MVSLVCFVFVSFITYTLGRQDSHIVRPCPHFEVDCIRHYFLSSGVCSPPVGHVPDVLHRPFTRYYIPSFNGTALQKDMIVKRFKSDIVEFYINRETDRAVLAFRSKFDVEAATQFTYLAPAREPVSATTKMGTKGGIVLFTVLFEGTQPIDLRNSFTYATCEVMPKIDLGPEPLSVKDHGFQTMYSGILSDWTTAFREGYLTAASYYSKEFIQYTLCDFSIRDHLYGP